MKLVDTSVWIDHLRKPDEELIALLENEEVYLHPFVVGEILLGSIANREALSQLLDAMPVCIIASMKEVRLFTNAAKLHGRGIGLVDAHLLVSTKLTPHTTILTRDKRLHSVATELGLA